MTDWFYEDKFIQLYHGPNQELIKTMPDESVDLIMTDPPYGIDFQSNQRVATPKLNKIVGDKEPPFAILSELFRVLRPDKGCYLFTRWDVQQQWIEETEKAGFEVKNVLVWDKEIHGMGDLDGDWGTEHEMIIFATKGRHLLNRPRPTTVIHCQKIAPGNIVHPNQKPLGVWYKMIRASTQPNDIVFDPYAGSCSSLLACRQLERRSVGCEIDLQWLEKIKPMLNQGEFSF